MEFESIPGVGGKTAAALAELDAPEAALESGDVLTIASAPGITEGRAAAIARGAIQRRHDDPGGFLATDRAKSLYDDALSILQQRAVTQYAKKRLETLYPSPCASRIQEVRKLVDRALARDPDPNVLDALAGVEPLADPSGLRVRDRCLATADAEQYAKARNEMPELSAEVVDDARDIDELARSYATVFVLDESFAGIDVSGDVRILPDALDEPETVVPERLLSFFATNREPILAAAAVHRLAGLEPPCDLAALEDGLDRVDDDGTIVGDDELRRLAVAVDDLDAAVGTAESVANDYLREVIQERNVTIEGQDFLSLVEQGARVDSLLARELDEDFETALDKARAHLRDSLSLAPEEGELADRIFDGDPTFPISRRDEAVSRLETELTAARDRRAATLKSELAADLADLREPVDQLVRNALELDVELAIARFATDFDCTLPEFSDEGFEITAGRSPLLDVEFADVEPVDYGVEGVTLL
ncbi:MAG: endonuclease MutS2, partial [Natrialbaceae archaeon]